MRPKVFIFRLKRGLNQVAHGGVSEVYEVLRLHFQLQATLSGRHIYHLFVKAGAVEECG